MLHRISKIDNASCICNESGKELTIIGTRNGMIQIRTNTEIVTFLVADRVAAYVILGCGFCDLQVEEINLCSTITEIDYRSTLLMAIKPSMATTDAPVQKKKHFDE